MARVFTRGFEDGEAAFPGDLTSGTHVYNKESGAVVPALALSVGDTRSISLGYASTVCYLYAHIVPQITTYDLLEVYIRIYAAQSYNAYTNTMWLQINDQAGNELVRLGQDKKIWVLGSVSGDTVASAPFDGSVWARFEFYLEVANPGQLIIRKNGVVIFSDSYDFTANGATSVGYVGGHRGESGTLAESFFFDDIAVNDTTGSNDVSYPGDGRIVGLFPKAVGTNTNMTAYPDSGEDNYEDVDDPATTGNDGDTTYVTTGASQSVDTYEFDDLDDNFTIPSSTAISRVTVMSVCRTPTTGLDIRGVVVDSGTSNGIVVTPEGEASYGINGSVVTHPAGSWTVARVNSAEFGIESI